MSQFTFYNLQSAIQYQPPIENWDKLQTSICLLLLLVVGNVIVILVALFLRRRLNDIEATRPPARKKRDKPEDKQE